MGTVVLEARFQDADSKWHIRRLGRLQASDNHCLMALKKALKGDDGADVVSVDWRSPLDDTVPPSWHSGRAATVTTVAEVLGMS